MFVLLFYDLKRISLLKRFCFKSIMQGLFKVKLCHKLFAKTTQVLWVNLYCSCMNKKSSYSYGKVDGGHVPDQKEMNHVGEIFPGECISYGETSIQKKLYNITVPNMKKNYKLGIQTAASLYMTNTAIAWAKLSRENDVIDWNISSMPQNAKKWHISSLYEMVLQVSSLLPKADVFVLEDMRRPHAAQSTNPVLLANMHLMECTTAMLFMYLNYYLSDKAEIPGDEHIHKVFFLKQYITARLSNTLIGGERVSAQSVMMDILNNSGESNTQFSPISVSSDFKSYYMSQKSLERESMCQALLLLMTFMDLAVRERKESVKFINNSSNFKYSEKKSIC